MSVYVDPCWEIYSLKNCVIDMILKVVFFRPYQTVCPVNKFLYQNKNYHLKTRRIFEFQREINIILHGIGFHENKKLS